MDEVLRVERAIKEYGDAVKTRALAGVDRIKPGEIGCIP